MAARRLIAILIVLLVVSTVAAALAPTLEQAADEETTTETTTAEDSTPGEPPVRPGLVRGSFDLDAVKEGNGGDPPVLRAERGDRIAIAVRSSESVQIRIPELGRLEWATRGSPARFELLAREKGELAVRTGDDRLVGRIVIGEARTEPPEEETGPPAEDPEAGMPPDAGAA